LSLVLVVLVVPPLSAPQRGQPQALVGPGVHASASVPVPPLAQVQASGHQAERMDEEFAALG
jgi:hypothetical protein